MFKINSKITDPEKFEHSMKLFDEVNAQDPNSESCDGKDQPKELLYSQRMTDCLEIYDPEASEALQLAVRSQHIKRWSKPRSEYPEGKVGYLTWRKELYIYHGDLAAELMQQAGYGAEIQERLKVILLKKQMKTDTEVQALEDVACLVFLGSYFEDFIEKHSGDKLINIVRKTWGKMSDKGHEQALKIDYSKKAKEVIDQALAD